MPRRAPKTSRARAPLGADPTPINSAYTTTLSSAYSSAYPSEAEDVSIDDAVAQIPISSLTISDAPAAGTAAADGSPSTAVEAPPETPARRVKVKPFRFMDLPTELRVRIYALHFGDSDVVDLDPDNHKRLYKRLFLLRACRSVYEEASYFFYSTRTFRVFPTSPGRFFKTKTPLLARLKPHQRACITSLELRLGPGWSRPPRGWVVNEALGLAECVAVRRLTVFVECDPSDNIFNGFRQADGFYEGFSCNLLDGVLGEMPFLDRVEFDAWSSVRKGGAMMKGLLDVARSNERQICWGPERGWTDNDVEDYPPVKSVARIWSSPGVVVLV